MRGDESVPQATPRLSRNVSQLSGVSQVDTEMGLRSRTPGPLDEDYKHRNGSLEQNERSPLMSPANEVFGLGLDHVPTETLDWTDGEDETSKSTFYLLMLTLSIGG